MPSRVGGASLPCITKTWSTGFWLWKREIKVQAQQVTVPAEYGDLVATARVAVSVDGKVVHDADIPWAMPRGEIMLPLQVYMLAKQPDYPHPEWQPFLEQFAFACEGFSPPEKMQWSKEDLSW